MTREEAISVLKEIIDESWIFSDVEKAPTIDACEMAISALSENKGKPKTGHWISNAEDDLKISEYTCSNCKGLSDEDFDFCPNCGARMKGGE